MDPTTSPTTQNNPSSDTNSHLPSDNHEDGSLTPEKGKNRRSQWTGLEAEIMRQVVAPRMMQAITALNAGEGVSHSSLSRYFHEAYKVPASTNTIAAWLKALNIKISTRAYVEMPKTPANPTQNMLDQQLQAFLANGGKPMGLSPLTTHDTLQQQVDLADPTAPPMTFQGAGAGGGPQGGFFPDPSFVPGNAATALSPRNP